MRRFSSVYKVKKEMPNYSIMNGRMVILTDFPMDVHGVMYYVFTEFEDSYEHNKIGIFSVVLDKDQVEEYLEYVGECLPQYSK